MGQRDGSPTPVPKVYKYFVVKYYNVALYVCVCRDLVSKFTVFYVMETATAEEFCSTAIS